MKNDIESDLNNHPHLIVMLTYDDYTVKNPEEIFESCRHSKALYWGIKEKPLPLERMKALYSRMRECGKATALEVVGYDEASALEGCRIAWECGCDYLMGTRFYPSVSRFCSEHEIRYLPFVGEVDGRPSVLRGSAAEMIAEGKRAIDQGAWGIDLLGYRYAGDAEALNRLVVKETPGRVCLAGSVDSYRRLDEIKIVSPWAFTIGSAFFDGKFGDTFAAQIDNVCDYMMGG